MIAVGWIGLAAPANVPAPILDRLAAEVDRILADPEVAEKLKASFVADQRGAPGLRRLHGRPRSPSGAASSRQPASRSSNDRR